MELTRPDSLITEEVCNNSTPSDSTKQCNYKESGCYKETKALNGGNTDSNNDNGKKIMAKIMEIMIRKKTKAILLEKNIFLKYYFFHLFLLINKNFIIS